jgi:hypothetical protein
MISRQHRYLHQPVAEPCTRGEVDDAALASRYHPLDESVRISSGTEGIENLNIKV